MKVNNWPGVHRTQTCPWSASIGKYIALAAMLSLLGPSATAPAQEEKKSEEEFVLESPTVGDSLPDLVVYDSQGNELRTSQLKGHYTVLTFGCLT
jgi:cytochrome oxidase Cu insertion factor (SCO1/SenC/PrrC family)